MHYIINKKFRFFPIERKLQSLSEPDLIKILATPASNCLFLLVKNAPEIVTHKELLYEVWEKDGIIVPLNTLSQNISLARKCIRTVSQTDDEVIVTIPRKGFRLHGEVESITPPLACDEEDTVNTHPKVPGETKPQKKSTNMYIVMGIALLISAIFFIIPSLQKEKSFFSDYTSVGVQDDCHFYGKNWGDSDNGSERRLNNMKNKVSTFGISCKVYPWVYLTKRSKYPVATSIYCKKQLPSTGDNECVSLFYYKEVK